MICYLRSTRALQACDNGTKTISVLQHTGLTGAGSQCQQGMRAQTALARVVASVTPLLSSQWPPLPTWGRGMGREEPPTHLEVPSTASTGLKSEPRLQAQPSSTATGTALPVAESKQHDSPLSYGWRACQQWQGEAL